MNIRRILLSATVALAATGAWAVKAWPGLHTVAQPDGTVLSYRIVGDEHCHAFATTDGFLLAHGEGGHLFYARKAADGRLLPSAVVAHNPSARSNGETTQLAQWGTKDFGKIHEQQQTLAGTKRAGRLPGESFPTTGNLKGIILLVEFADNSMQEGHDSTLFHKLMNDEGCTLENATGSARDYFIDQSGGLFTPDFDVAGTIKLSHRMAYYGANNSQGSDSNPGEMVKEACEYAAEKFGVDFSKYDFDNDGTVDFVYVIYAGYAESYGASSNTIWPHAALLDNLGVSCSVGGKKINRYACSSELKYTTGTRVEGIGTFCHEFSHVLGLPDMYNTYSTSSLQVGRWDVMDQGNYNNESHTPPSMSAFERASLGWMELTEIDTPADSMTLPEMTANKVAYRISTANDNEYFTLENRQQQGWDAYLPGKGLMIMHITYEPSAWNGNYVNAGTFPRYDLVEADGTQGNGEQSDLYPTADNNMFTDYSSPNSLSRSGGPTEKGVTNIRDNDGVISFTFMKDRLRRPVIGETTDITANAFTVNWGEVDGAIAYRLHFDEVLPDSINPLLLDEDFNALTDGEYPKSGTSDIGQTLDSYLSSSPWYGTELYSCGGYLRMGGYGQSGKLYTPTIDAQAQGGKLTIALDARSYPAKNVAFTVELVDVAKGTTLASQSFKANKTEQCYTMPADGIASRCRFVITTNNERLFINRLRVVKGLVESDKADSLWSLGPKSWDIDSVVGTSYTQTGLEPGRTYRFCVSALAEKDLMGSLASDISSATTASASTGIATVGQSSAEPVRTEYYDLAGHRLSAPAKGLVIWRKVYADGRVETGKSH